MRIAGHGRFMGARSVCDETLHALARAGRPFTPLHRGPAEARRFILTSADRLTRRRTAPLPPSGSNPRPSEAGQALERVDLSAWREWRHGRFVCRPVAYIRRMVAELRAESRGPEALGSRRVGCGTGGGADLSAVSRAPY